MTGDDSFHAHCFKCKICKNRIDDLVFAKTSQGIYCMDCHNERMIKIRKHNEKKAEREKAGGSSSSRDRYRPRENGVCCARLVYKYMAFLTSLYPCLALFACPGRH